MRADSPCGCDASVGAEGRSAGRAQQTAQTEAHFLISSNGTKRCPFMISHNLQADVTGTHLPRTSVMSAKASQHAHETWDRGS